MALMAVLESDLRALSSEARRRYPAIKDGAEHAILKLRSLSSPNEIAHNVEIVRIFLMACDVKSVKLSVICLSCLQKLISHDVVAQSALKEILSTLKDASITYVTTNIGWPRSVDQWTAFKLEDLYSAGAGVDFQALVHCVFALCPNEYGGTVVEKCCHFFDLMRLFTAANPVRVMASGANLLCFHLCRHRTFEESEVGLDDASFHLCMQQRIMGNQTFC